MCNRRSGDFVQDGVSLMIALPALLLATAAVSAGPPADDDILEKARKALLLRSELLLDYSVEVTSEVHHRNSAGSPRNGGPGAPVTTEDPMSSGARF